MADIRKALGKSKEYEIFGEKVSLKPLTVKNLDLMLKFQKESTKKEAMELLVEHYAKQVFPEATVEEISEMSFETMGKILEFAMDVNGLSPEKDGNKKPEHTE